MRFDARARAWVEHGLGRRHRVVGTRRARGGVSSVVHRVLVEDARGARAPYMLRRVPVRDDVPDHDPGTEVLNESYALQHFGGGPIPELVTVDPSGEACGAAALLSTWLPGRPDVRPRDPSAWIRELATALESVPGPPASELRFGEFVPWFDTSPAAPRWSRSPDAWERVRARLDERLPTGGAHRFVHRDFHPGNVLFDRGHFSGIVDWTHASVGAPEVDTSRVRVQIAILADRTVADEFLRCTEHAATYDPLWDALVACEIGPWAEDLLQFNEIGAQLTLAHIRETFDAFVEDAARHL